MSGPPRAAQRSQPHQRCTARLLPGLGAPTLAMYAGRSGHRAYADAASTNLLTSSGTQLSEPWEAHHLHAEPVKVVLSNFFYDKGDRLFAVPRDRDDEDTRAGSSGKRSDSSKHSSLRADSPAWGQHMAHTDDGDNFQQPKWVGVHGTGGEAVPCHAAQPFSAGCTSMVLYNLPSNYDESVVLQELRDAGFAKGRDVRGVRVFAVGEKKVCVVELVDGSVARSFLASFGDRPMRFAVGQFGVVALSSTGDLDAVRREGL